uniref:Uncharacterized protein n=1 Tax=Ananas comosus var. bracteatus TaxID=296719 RepID=A0A6V7Q3S3_ANACO|nr:unnamed protein product [Ananas comosus var. bracteatus]
MKKKMKEKKKRKEKKVEKKESKQEKTLVIFFFLLFTIGSCLGADDNAMNLRNRAVPRNFGSEQPSNSDNNGERQAVLPAEGETSGQSGQQEPSLSQALGQMTRVLQVLDQNSHTSTA